MIFVAVGTTKFQFDRLLHSVDRACCLLKSNERLYVQQASSKYSFGYKHVTCYSEVPFNRIVALFQKARLLILHGGAGMVILALRYAHAVPLVIPRSQEFGEHIDNHQVYFSQILKRKLAKVILPRENLDKEILRYIQTGTPRRKVSISPSLQPLIRGLISYCEA